jgi:hypothetical protein
MRMNASPRQIVVRFVNAKTQDAKAARSRKGTRATLLRPSASFKPHPITAVAVTSRMASAEAKTINPKRDPSVEIAKRHANGTGRMIMVPKRHVGQAARLF